MDNWEIFLEGYDHKYIYSHIGYNLKVTDMQAAIGVDQLQKLPEFIEQRKKNFSRLFRALEKYSAYLVLPIALKDADPAGLGSRFLYVMMPHLVA